MRLRPFVISDLRQLCVHLPPAAQLATHPSGLERFAALLGSDGRRVVGQMLSYVHERHPFKRRNRCGVGGVPAADEHALQVAAGVQPVRYAGIAQGNHGTEATIGVEARLVAVQAALAMNELDGVPELVVDLHIPVAVSFGNVGFEDQGFVFLVLFLVALLTGCVMDTFYNPVHWATIDVLVANGYFVRIPEQTCCGALHVHAGLRDEARKLARRNIDAVLEQRTHKRVIVFRPIFPVGGQDLGYLPGSEAEKMLPWGAAVTDALEAIAGREVIEEVIDRGLLEVLPLTHIRGRSLTDSFVVIDEAQNLERSVLLTALSRLGENSRVVLTHDVAQRDNLRVGRHDGIVSVIETLKGHPLFGHVTLTRAERSRVAALVTQVLDEATPG